MKENSNVLIICKNYYPSIGGVEKHIYEIQKILAKKGYTFRIICENRAGFISKTESSVIRLKPINIKYFGLLVRWIQMFTFMKAFLDADIVHIHDVFIWVLPMRLILFRKKFYITHHGWEGKLPISKNSIFQKKLACYLCNNYVLVGKYIASIYGLESKNVIYGAAKPNRHPVRVRSRLSVLYLGRLDHSTGVSVLLDSLKQKRFKVVFCGNGELNSACKKFGAVTGFVRNPGRYLSKNKICIACGYLSTIEALQQGCFTIVLINSKVRKQAFNMSPMKSWIKLVRTPRQLSQRIEEFENNRNHYSERALQAKKWADHQTWNKLADFYEKLWSAPNGVTIQMR